MAAPGNSVEFANFNHLWRSSHMGKLPSLLGFRRLITWPYQYSFESVAEKREAQRGARIGRVQKRA